MRRRMVLGALTLLAGITVVALAQDASRATKSKRATRVSVTESVPLTVVTSGTPLAVDVHSMPNIEIANPTGKVVTLPEFDDVTLSAAATSSEIDVDGCRSASVFVSCPTYTGSGVSVILEFGCAGIWANPYFPQPNPSAILYQGSPNLVFSQEVHGPKMRIRIAPSLPISTFEHFKAVVYLKR